MRIDYSQGDKSFFFLEFNYQNSRQRKENCKKIRIKWWKYYKFQIIKFWHKYLSSCQTVKRKEFLPQSLKGGAIIIRIIVKLVVSLLVIHLSLKPVICLMAFWKVEGIGGGKLTTLIYSPLFLSYFWKQSIVWVYLVRAAWGRKLS